MCISMLIFKFPSVTSTQDLAEAIYQIINADEFVIVAEEQTRARGRYKREWYSPKGGLWFTYVIKNYNAEKIPFLTFRSSLAVRKVLSTFLNVKILSTEKERFLVFLLRELVKEQIVQFS